MLQWWWLDITVMLLAQCQQQEARVMSTVQAKGHKHILVGGYWACQLHYGRGSFIYYHKLGPLLNCGRLSKPRMPAKAERSVITNA